MFIPISFDEESGTQYATLRYLICYPKANFRQLLRGQGGGSFTKPILITTFNTCSTQRSPEASKRVWVSNPENQCQILILSPEYHLLSPSDKRLDLVWHELFSPLSSFFNNCIQIMNFPWSCVLDARNTVSKFFLLTWNFQSFFQELVPTFPYCFSVKEYILFRIWMNKTFAFC